MNLANRLTLARIILIPLFMAFLLLQIPKGHTLFPHQNIVATLIFLGGLGYGRIGWLYCTKAQSSNGSGKIYGSAGR